MKYNTFYKNKRCQFHRACSYLLFKILKCTNDNIILTKILFKLHPKYDRHFVLRQKATKITKIQYTMYFYENTLRFAPKLKSML